MFALLDWFKNVWKKAAIPIWDKDQPNETNIISAVEVLVKKDPSRTKVPSK